MDGLLHAIYNLYELLSVIDNLYDLLSVIDNFIFTGLCAAPLWTAKATYISTTARNYSKSSGLSVDAVMTNFFGIFFTMFQCSQVVGNSISSIVLKPCLGN